ncbi:MAG: hypothetical protein ACK6DK_05135, partial [Gemmatimonadota bacterium]
MTRKSNPGPILYERFMPSGPVVRVRRTSAVGQLPGVAGQEGDRRAASPRGSRGAGTPPPLREGAGPTHDAVL